jgi:hypothetical protein
VDRASILTSQLLDEVCLMNEAFITLAVDFRSRPEVARVMRGCDLRKYTTGAVLEAYVDVETQKAQAFSWWLEMRWDQHQWFIESSVRQSHQDGQDVRIEFPNRVAESLDDLVKHLRHATYDLLAAAQDFDFDCAE